MSQYRVLLVEDNPGDARLVQLMLDKANSASLTGFDWDLAESLKAALASLERERFDAVLLDLSLPDSQGLGTIRKICLAEPDLPVVVLTGLSNEEIAFQAVQAGAQDYLVKGEIDKTLLTRTILYSIERKQALVALRRSETLLERRNRELALLNHASQIFNSTLELDQVLLRVLEMLVPQMSEASTFWLVDQETCELICRQAQGPQSEKLPGLCLPPGTGLIGWVAQHGRILLTPDAQADPRYYKGIEKRTEMKARAVLTVPLNVKGKVIGVLQLLNTEANDFDRSEIEMIEALASVAAVAVENARLYAEVKNLAITDELTGLYNRRGFNLLADQMMKQALRSGDDLLLVFIDVDRLKMINDSRGHQAGDQALIAVSDLMKGTFRSSDLLARLGGDEFAILAPLNGNGAGSLDISLTHRIKTTTLGDPQHNEHARIPSFSIGMARWNSSSACTLKELLEKADSQMYAEKNVKINIAGNFLHYEREPD